MYLLLAHVVNLKCNDRVKHNVHEKIVWEFAQIRRNNCTTRLATISHAFRLKTKFLVQFSKLYLEQRSKHNFYIPTEAKNALQRLFLKK